MNSKHTKHRSQANLMLHQALVTFKYGPDICRQQPIVDFDIDHQKNLVSSYIDHTKICYLPQQNPATSNIHVINLYDYMDIKCDNGCGHGYRGPPPAPDIHGHNLLSHSISI